jgi:hypothetical protein
LHVRAGFEPTTLVVIGTDCIGSNKSNHHTIMTTMALIATIYIYKYLQLFQICSQFKKYHYKYAVIPLKNTTEILLKVALNTINKQTNQNSIFDIKARNKSGFNITCASLNVY